MLHRLSRKNICAICLHVMFIHMFCVCIFVQVTCACFTPFLKQIEIKRHIGGILLSLCSIIVYKINSNVNLFNHGIGIDGGGESMEGLQIRRLAANTLLR